MPICPHGLLPDMDRKQDRVLVLIKMAFQNPLQSRTRLGFIFINELIYQGKWHKPKRWLWNCTRRAPGSRDRTPSRVSRPPVTILLPPGTPWSSFAYFWTQCQSNSIECAECRLLYLAPLIQRYAPEIHLWRECQQIGHFHYSIEFYCMNMQTFIYPFIHCGYWVCLQLEAVRNTSTTILVHAFWCTRVCISVAYTPRNGIVPGPVSVWL